MTTYTPGCAVEVHQCLGPLGWHWKPATYLRTESGSPLPNDPTVLVRLTRGLFTGCVVRYAADRVRPLERRPDDCST